MNVKVQEMRSTLVQKILSQKKDGGENKGGPMRRRGERDEYDNFHSIQN